MGKKSVYGLVATMDGCKNQQPASPWIAVVEGGFVTRLSQEHGVVALPEPACSQVKIGDLVYIIPAHICLTVSALGQYTTPDGEIITTMNKVSESLP